MKTKVNIVGVDLQSSDTPIKEPKDLRVIPLAGVQEIGMNSTVIETPNDMLIVDAGMGFPSDSLFGVDFLMPDYRYVYERKHKLRGILITHGHFDHIGALAYMLEDLGYPPVYGPRFAIQLIEDRLREFHLKDKVKLIEVGNDSDNTIAGFKVGYFHITHSIPDSCGIVIEALGKKVLVSGDFKFDDHPFVTKVSSYERIKEFGNRGIDLLLSDSTNSFQPGRAESDSVIVDQLEDVIRKASGRVVVATFSSLVNRMQIIISIAEKLGRTVFVSGRSMKNAYKIAHKWGYIKHRDGVVKESNRMQGVPDEKLIFLTTGSQGEETAGLSRIARGEHKEYKLKTGDTVMLASSVIPGNANVVQKLIDDLIIAGADVYHNAQMDLHTSGHGYQEDQKLMIEMTKPKYFMPVHGFQSHLLEHSHTAQAVGVPKANIIIPRNGYIFEFEGSQLKQIGEIKVEHVFVDVQGAGEVGQAVLKERIRLANSGVIVMLYKVDWKSFTLSADPQIYSRGFVFVKNSQAIVDKIADRSKEFFNASRKKYADKGEKKFRDLRYVLEKRMTDYIFRETGKEPLIITLMV